MGGLGSLLFDVGASTVTLSTDAARAVTISASMVNDINANLAKIGTGANFNGVSSGIQGLVSDVNNLKSAVAGVFGVGLGTGLAKEVMEYADAWQGVSNRIRTTVSDASQVDAIQRSILDVAQQTGQAVDTTAKTYQRLETVLASSGKTQAQAQAESIALTKILNEEIIVSGANTGEATRAVSDLVHGLAGGVLQARQFNPIMRQMPDLALQIAKGLGVSVAQLEEMVHKGLPAEQVLAALSKQGAEINQRFTALPQTFARAWQQLDNSVEAYIGTAEQAGTLGDTVKAGIVSLGNNISTVADIIFVAAGATTAWLGARTIGAIGAMSTSVYEMVTAQGAYATAAIKSAQADVQATAAKQAAAAATVDRVAATIAERDAQISALTVTESELQQEIALAEARARTGAYAADVLAEEARLEGVRAELSAVTANLTKLEDLQDATYRRLAQSEAGLTGATAALTASQSALTVAQTEAVSVLGLLGRGASSLFTLIGGWPTVVLGAAIATYTWATNTTDLTSAISALNQQSKQQEEQSLTLSDVIRGLVSGEQARKQSLEEMAQAQRNVAQAELDALKAQRDQYLSMENVTGSVGLSTIQWGIYELKVHNAESAINALDQAQANVNFTAFTAKVASAVQTLQRMFNLVPTAAIAPPDLTKLQEQIDKETAAEAKRVATFGLGKAATFAWEREQAVAALTAGLTGKALDDQTRNIYAMYDGLITLGQAQDADIAGKKASTEGMRQERAELSAQAKAYQAYQADVGKLSDLEDQLSSGLGGPYLSALKTYQKGIDLTTAAWTNAVAAGVDNDEFYARISKDQEDLATQYERTTAEIKAQHDVMAQAQADLQLQEQLLGVLPRYQEAATAGLQAYNAALKANVDLYGDAIPAGEDIKDVLTAQLPLFVQTKQAIHDIGEQQRQNQEVTRQWADIWTSAGNTIADDIGKVVVEGESLFDDLKNVAKQVVESIISYFAKLAIINPILNSIFGGAITGGGGSLLPTLAGSGGSGGGFFGTLLGGSTNADFTSTAAGQTQFSIMNPSSWVMAGKSLWNGWFGGASSADLGTLGDYSGYGTQYLDYGTSFDATQAGTGAASGIGYGGYGSGLGQGLGIAGGLYAGYNEYNRAGGGVAGLAGGAAYGVGTYFAGAGLATTAATGSLAAGAAAIPVVGWIALAAMLIDKFTGGGLFGTGASLNGGYQQTDVTSSGANVWGMLDLKGKKPLFGGSYHESQSYDPGDAARDSANLFFKTLQDGINSFARQFGEQTAVVASGSFQTQFDKHGNQTGTKEWVNGIEYDNETQQEFAERIGAQSQIDFLKTIGVDVTEYTDQFLSNADSLAQAVQDVAQAMGQAQQDLKDGIDVGGKGTLQGDFEAIQTYDTDGESQAATYGRLSQETQDLQNGIGLLTGQSTIADIEAFLTESQRFGETLSQTYARLEQAGQQYEQFVGQFKPQAKYVDDYEASLAAIKAQYIANVKQANDLAKAAGLAGASTEDLTNIMQMAAKQEADALKQLQVSAQSLAFSLGITTVGSLDDVNAEIARLQQQANQGTTAVGNFGNAMQTAAQQATDAMNLMLGDLSPYNDKYKLQIALQGLYAGTATKDQVLSIGKDLWTTTSSQYQALFNQVMAVPDHGNGSGGGGGGGAQHQGLSAADSQRLKDLLKEQQTLQAAATLQQYQTLAQQVAEIASSKGEDWKQVLTDMNVDIAAFEKGLGMTDDQTNAYIQAAQDAVDSNNDNTASIVFWLQKIFEQGGGTIIVQTPAPGPTGHSSHSMQTTPRPIFNHGRGGQPARIQMVAVGP